MDNVALVTGASSGIGRELARLHAEQGRDLVVVARRLEALEALREELEAKHRVQVMPLSYDLTQANAREDLAAKLEQEGILVEYLINNAGFGLAGRFHDQSWSQLSGMIALNITALTHLTHLFLPKMVEWGAGRILNVSSTAGFMPGPLQAVYFATKAYVNSFTQAVATELEGTGVTVTALCPGPVDTEFAERANFSADGEMFARARTPRYTAQRGYDAMEAGDREVISEPSLNVLIKGVLPFLPARQVNNLVKKMQASSIESEQN